MKLEFFKKSVNPAYSLLYTSPAFPSCVPFTLFSTVPFDSSLDEDTFSMLTNKAVSQTQKAIKAYYAQNGFKSPEKYARPFANVEKEHEEPEVDELSEFIEIFRISEKNSFFVKIYKMGNSLGVLPIYLLCRFCIKKLAFFFFFCV